MEDNELIKKYHLEEAKKRFQQICEYTFITSPVIAEDDEDDEIDKEVEQSIPQDDEQDASSDTQMDSQNGQQDNNDVSVQMPNEEPQEEMPQDENGMDDSSAFPQDGMASDEDSVDTDTMQTDDEVIDVDDLTKSQEASEYKIDGVNDKLAKLLNVVTKFSTALEQNDKKIEDLKSEFEKRNPTEEEQLNIRSQSSYPYSVKPKDYWDSKSSNSNYNVIYDNDVPANEEQEEYKFTKNDLKGMDDRSIAKSFDEPMKLKDILSF